MTNYQRTAALTLRLIGAAWTGFFAFAWGIYFIEVAFGVDVQHYPMHQIIGNVAYMAIGLLVIIGSKPLGRLLARGLD